MNLRKGLIAAVTALTVSAAGVGVASATTTTPTTTAVAPLSSGSSFLAGDDDEDSEEKPEGSSLSSSKEDDGKDDTELSSQDGLEELNTVLKLVSTAVGAVATIYGALTALDII